METPTLENPGLSSTMETPTIESSRISTTMETPTIETWSPEAGGTARMPGFSNDRADQTEEIDLEDLGLDLDGLDEAARDMATGHQEALPEGGNEIDFDLTGGGGTIGPDEPTGEFEKDPPLGNIARAMGRDASGVQGMRMRGDDEVISINIAQDDADLLVVTENGYGKRTPIVEYTLKGRGGMGVKTIHLTEAKGKLAGSRVVRDGYQLMLISTGGTVIKMAVDDVKRLGRATQGVIVMRLGKGEMVSSIAPVVSA
jgi:hypothetical protein